MNEPSQELTYKVSIIQRLEVLSKASGGIAWKENRVKEEVLNSDSSWDLDCREKSTNDRVKYVDPITKRDCELVFHFRIKCHSYNKDISYTLRKLQCFR